MRRVIGCWVVSVALLGVGVAMLEGKVPVVQAKGVDGVPTG